MRTLTRWSVPGIVIGIAAASYAVASETAHHSPDTQFAHLADILLAENPEILAARAWQRSRGERVVQEKALPDPELSYRYFVETPETRVGPQRHALELAQRVPWGGKRRRRSEQAEHDAKGASWRVRDLERARIAELKHAYFEAAYLQEALEVNREETSLLERFEQIALTRYATGEGIQQSAIRVQTDISRLADRKTALDERLDAVIRGIARLIGRPEAPLWLDPIALPLRTFRLDPEVLEVEASLTHPRVRAAEESIAADEAWIRGQELASRPNLRFGVGFTEVGRRDDPAGVLVPPHDNGQNVWSVMVGVTIPVHRDRIRAGVAEAQESRLANEWRLESTRDRLRFDVQEASIRVRSIEERARLYREVIVPQAEESVASAEAAYTTNRVDFLDLLDAERVLFQVRLTYHRLLADYWIALADLELAVGRRLPPEGGES